MRYGEMVGEGRCCFETQEDLLAETINGIVLVLRAVKPKQAKALKVRYKYQTLLNLECAKRAKMDEDIFNYSLKAGKRHVKDALKEIGCG